MKRVIGIVVALAAATVCGPVGVAHAEDPFSCNGSPEIPETYVCIVRFEVGVDPVVSYVPVDVPAQPAEVPSQSIYAGGNDIGDVPSQTATVPAHRVHVPVVCGVVFGLCAGPFDPSTPEVEVTTPPVTQDVPFVGYSTPPVEQTTPPVSGQVPVLGAEVPPNALLVVWYRGACTYFYPDGSRAKAKAATPSSCR